ncbi:MAG: flagellar protein FliS [Defluviitaleaceae bacterium]|nr:flagellar protein FliS [Defluviitaleaceae bacterium]MCL2836888.1 flagellar protein FliS [Defluviitaleaceae bacterium]
MARTDDYILKITNATPVELVLISYDILTDDITSAIGSHGSDPGVFIASINRARETLIGLIGALDTDNPVAKGLYPLYERINTLFISSLTYEKKEGLDEALKILGILREGWIKARESEPEGGALFENAPKVYSGLTYGRKGPNDYIDTDPGRGIKV